MFTRIEGTMFKFWNIYRNNTKCHCHNMSPLCAFVYPSFGSRYYMYLSNTNVHALRLFARVMKVGRGVDPGLYKIWILLPKNLADASWRGRQARVRRGQGRTPMILDQKPILIYIHSPQFLIYFTECQLPIFSHEPSYASSGAFGSDVGQTHRFTPCNLEKAANPFILSSRG